MVSVLLPYWDWLIFGLVVIRRRVRSSGRFFGWIQPSSETRKFDAARE